MTNKEEKHGILFNLKNIRESSSEIWEKYRLMFLVCNFADEKQVEFYEIVHQVGFGNAWQFFKAVAPEELRIELEKVENENEKVKVKTEDS